jgi:hypothetical protein
MLRNGSPHASPNLGTPTNRHGQLSERLPTVAPFGSVGTLPVRSPGVQRRPATRLSRGKSNTTRHATPKAQFSHLFVGWSIQYHSMAWQRGPVTEQRFPAVPPGGSGVGAWCRPSPPRPWCRPDGAEDAHEDREEPKDQPPCLGPEEGLAKQVEDQTEQQPSNRLEHGPRSRRMAKRRSKCHSSHRPRCVGPTRARDSTSWCN